MKALIITATKLEAELIAKNLEMKEINDFFLSSKKFDTDLLITGIGIPATIFSMFTAANLGIYDLIINAGIAGSFNKDIMIGNVANIISDSFADVLISDNNVGIPVFETKFNENFKNLINNGRIYNTSDYPAAFKTILQASGISVNIPERINASKFDIETMEGAAFMLVCKHFKKNFIQLRGISNLIGITEKQDWNFKEPISAYSKIITDFLTKIN